MNNPKPPTWKSLIKEIEEKIKTPQVRERSPFEDGCEECQYAWEGSWESDNECSRTGKPINPDQVCDQFLRRERI